ncbi:hypothetical protein TEA_010401 [Camellia sinensis var. sinensis]|uniref:Uncharacterized protein n=1 Tax=Camellia sinensis var. sinensis TaxID=542762 RepID=A0A4S4DWP3_CAMSN|nr:hypothetical protein TEA_010401 [Camellia sinensis var. sinensis]
MFFERIFKMTILFKNEDRTKVEYRVWNPFYSKLAAAILGGVNDIWILFSIVVIFVIKKPGARVLYLGAASGTTVSHVSDMLALLVNETANMISLCSDSLQNLESLNLNGCQKITDKGIEAITAVCSNLKREIIDKYIKDEKPTLINPDKFQQETESVINSLQQEDTSLDCGIIVYYIMRQYVFKNNIMPTFSNEECNQLRADMLTIFLTDQQAAQQQIVDENINDLPPQ